VHPAFQRGLLLAIATLAWFYLGAAIFEPASPRGTWFLELPPGTKVKVGAWVFVGLMLAADSVWMVLHGLRQGRIR
jgi:hypothetical protein